MIKLVLIDFDDTLSLTEESCFRLENEIAVSMGLPPMSREVHLRTWGSPLREAILQRLPGVDADEFLARHKQLLPSYVERGELDGISPENLLVLQQLRERGIRVGILTSRTLPEVEHLMHASHQLSKYLDAFYHADNLEAVKPNPKAFAKPLQDFHVAPDEAVYVGDSVNDGISAKGAGLHFIADLESGLRHREDFAAISVDVFVLSFPEILEYILQH